MGKNNVKYVYPSVAQLDNAADSDSEDRGFESLRAGQIRIAVFSDPFSFAFFLAMLYNIADISRITSVCKAQRGDSSCYSVNAPQYCSFACCISDSVELD